jgi:hypothetical protein
MPPGYRHSWLRGPAEKRSENIVSVPVEVATRPVISLGHPRIGMPSHDLDVAQRDTSIEGRRAVTVAEG